MTLDLTLKAAATLLLALSGYQFMYESTIPLIPVLLANILFVISVFSRSRPRRIAVISMALAVIIPIGAFRSYVNGETSFIVTMLNVLLFVYVAYVSLQTLRAHAIGSVVDKTLDTFEES